MCGIVGYVGGRPVTDVLLKGLRRLEYRGYDSSGVALFNSGKIEVHRAAGRIAEIEPLLAKSTQSGVEGGIGHTRWATHGAPNTRNAHPHRVGDIVLVHNGIIENFREIQKMVHGKGMTPSSETDSELFAFLVQFEMAEERLGFVEAVRRSFLKITGSSSVVVMCEKQPGLIVGVRNGSPLVAASNPDLGTMLASDAQPLLDYTDTVHFLEDGDMVVCRNERVEFFEAKTGRPISRKAVHLDWSADRLDKNGYPHYMLKEIHEQPRTIRDTLNANFANSEVHLPFDFVDHPGIKALNAAERLIIVACGTSWHSALMGKYWFERWTRLSVEVELASEFRYRRTVLRPTDLVMGISQSGETADTLAVIQDVNKRGTPTCAITNVKGSTIAREAKSVFYTCAGPEIGVASTKAFTGQMLMLICLAGKLGRDAAIGQPSPAALEELSQLYRELFEVPYHVNAALERESATSKAIRDAARATQHSKGFFFIGRGYSFPQALEGALKLKEIAYVHAEGYAAGELKHGPIAMLEPSFTVIVMAPRDRWYEKTVSNLQEVKARGANLIAIGHADDTQVQSMCDHFIPFPIHSKGASGASVMSEALLPFLIAPMLQLFAYEIAVLKGTDVDQPRNLAKSVTVE